MLYVRIIQALAQQAYYLALVRKAEPLLRIQVEADHVVHVAYQAPAMNEKSSIDITEPCISARSDLQSLLRVPVVAVESLPAVCGHPDLAVAVGIARHVVDEVASHVCAADLEVAGADGVVLLGDAGHRLVVERRSHGLSGAAFLEAAEVPGAGIGAEEAFRAVVAQDELKVKYVKICSSIKICWCPDLILTAARHIVEGIRIAAVGRPKAAADEAKQHRQEQCVSSLIPHYVPINSMRSRPLMAFLILSLFLLGSLSTNCSDQNAITALSAPLDRGPSAFGAHGARARSFSRSVRVNQILLPASWVARLTIIFSAELFLDRNRITDCI